MSPSRPSSSHPGSTHSSVSGSSSTENMTSRARPIKRRPRPAQREDYNPTYLPWKKRLDHFTWSWFECTMSTGAIATLLGQQPYSFHGLKTIGKIFFILDIVLFLAFSACITYRFIHNRGSLKLSLHHPHESFFFGAFFVSIALIIYCIELYGVPSSGPWLVKTLEILFWLYAAIVILVAVFQYHVIFDRRELPVKDAMPAWILPVYPFLVLGVLGSTLLKSQPPGPGFNIFIGSVTFQGLGWTIAFLMLSLYFTRLINSNLPEIPKRPGMYVAVGPAAYTANACIALGLQAPKHVPENLLGINSFPVGDAFKAFGFIMGVFLWLISFWFSAIATISIVISAKESHFTLNHWGFIFPNAGMTIALIYIANALNSPGIKGVCSAATIILVMLWIWVAVLNVKGVLQRKVLWPGMDEDMEDIEGHGHKPGSDQDDGDGEV
ncbi:c4-dicarboxylate transporter malic acid transport protein [Alternaria burnsii]|uniref:C4-dicarboxylate transporter malic acid transport protein n=1 Tax=Alternaria burnsii TaxID=1187904 RepID=A0A8H7AX69_9PLEO|nr:c4-dicarboxylate transporter malic acid transport protein [Alternaria burnsii]KAF7673214.1 c4-dicarboxylate transporter malic acid transport protein [Alternaria burnsii]